MQPGVKTTMVNLALVSASRDRCGCCELTCEMRMGEERVWFRLLVERQNLPTGLRKLMSRVELGTLAAFAQPVPLYWNVVGTLLGVDDPPEGFGKDGFTAVLSGITFS